MPPAERRPPPGNKRRSRAIPFIAIAGALCILLLGAASDTAQAQTEGPQIDGRAGLDGYCKEGAWMPVRVTVSNDGDAIEGDLRATTDNSRETWDFTTQASLPSVSRKEWTLYVFPAEGDDEIAISLHAGTEQLAEVVAPIDCVDSSGLLLGVWAANPSIFNSQTVVRTMSATRLVQLEASDIPDRALGLAMLDTLTISDVDTGGLADGQRAALLAWVAGGGRLIVAGGPGWQKTAAGLEALLPLIPGGTQTLEGLDGLADYAGQASAPEGAAVAATGQLQDDAQVLAWQDGVPLVVVRRHGFGQVIYLTIDPALEPLRTWTGMEDFYRALLRPSLDLPSWRDGIKAWSEADSALNAIPGLGLPSAWLICTFLLCYVAVVGPLNFVVLRRLNRREFAWISIPALVVFFSGCIFVSGTSLIGNRAILNRLAIVQVWPGEAMARVDGLLGVFSPARDRFSLNVEGDFAVHPVPVAGFQAERVHQTMLQAGSDVRVPEVQVGTGALEGFALAGHIRAPRFEHDLIIEWMPPGGARQLSGQVTNRSGLDLKDALILSTGGATPIGDLDDGDSAPVSIFLPGGGATPLAPGPGGPAPQFGTDDTLFEIFGTSYLYIGGGTSIENVRRFNLFSAALDRLDGTRGSQVYLLGWTDEAPFETGLDGGLSRNTDTTLYIVHLVPGAGPAGDSQGGTQITPNRFYWNLYGPVTGTGDPGPYSSSVSSGAFAVSFHPIEPLTFSGVAALTLHLEGYGRSGPIIFDLSLWDFSLDRWVGQPGVSWGDHAIENPERYVSAEGEIRLQVAYPGATRIDIERADFTLELEP